MANAKVNTKDAINEINNLINSFNSLVTATGQVAAISQGNFKKLETALAALKIISDQATTSLNKMSDAQKQDLAAVRARAKATKDVTDAMQAEAKAVKKVADEQKRLNEDVKKGTTLFGGMLSGVKSLLAAFGIMGGLQIFANLIKNAYDLTKQFDGMKFALQTIEKDIQKVMESQRFLMQITKDFGVELASTTERWIRFLAAAKQSGVTLKDTEDIFRSVTKAGSVLGLQTDDLSTVYLALEQMMSKGKVTTEELRRQLGEKLPGAIGIMAAAIGVNVNELDKMLKKGEVLSAEVLPKFAKALEYAYGIETVDKIETITSKQNELTNAWEVFVKSVIGGSGLIGKAVDVASKSVAALLRILTPKSVLAEAKYQEDVMRTQKSFDAALISSSRDALDRRLAVGKKYADVKAATEKAALDYSYAVAHGADKKDIDRLQNVFAAKNKILNEYNERVEATARNTSIANLKGAEASLKNITNLLEIAKKAGRQDGEAMVDELQFKKARAEAVLAVYRLRAESSTSVGFVDVEEEKKRAKKYLDTIKDLTNEEKIARLNAAKAINDGLLESDETGQAARTKAMQENSDIRVEIATLQYKEAMEKAREYRDKELAELKRAQGEEVDIIGNQKQYIADINKNYQDQEKIANTNYKAAIVANEKQFNADMVSLRKWLLDNYISIADDEFNIDIMNAKATYEASKKTAEDKERLERKLYEVGVAQSNALLDVRINDLEAMKGVSKEMDDMLDRQIRKLKAAKDVLVPVDDDTLKVKMAKLQQVLEYVGEISQALTDLGDAIFDRRIQQIDKEIKAESDKYDKLIDMAEGNKDQQERLEIEKEENLRKLEAKKLREEQRKAKFDKANAIIQIGINTAIAVSKAVAEFPITGGMPWTAIVIALGAIQTAAVLAQPIPQYEDGLINAAKDHIGMINDGKEQEYIERDGAILTTSTKNAIINLKKGDTVHKSFNDMVNSSDILKDISRSVLLNNLNRLNNDQAMTMEIMLASQLKDLRGDIKKGIHDGFNKVTINNVTKIDLGWLSYKNDTL